MERKKCIESLSGLTRILDNLRELQSGLWESWKYPESQGHFDEAQEMYKVSGN